MRPLLLFCLLLHGIPASAQDSIVSNNRYVRVNYDNDFFSATDRYYTQGIRLDYIAPWICYSPASYALIRLNRQAQNYYGLSAEQDCFTPLSIRRDTIFRGERPYAASFFITHRLISIDRIKKRRLTTSLDLGIIGPCAKCEEEQKAIHKALVNIQPLGWQFQISSSYTINYDATFEQGIFSSRYMELIGVAGARSGTLYDDLSAGPLLRIGWMPSYFDHLGVIKHASGRPFQCYLSLQGLGSLVGYNATMQGGLFDNNSVYTIPAAHITRGVFTGSAGIVLAYKRVSLEYTKVYITPEFYKGLDHGWGHCVITVCF